MYIYVLSIWLSICGQKLIRTNVPFQFFWFSFPTSGGCQRGAWVPHGALLGRHTLRYMAFSSYIGPACIGNPLSCRSPSRKASRLHWCLHPSRLQWCPHPRDWTNVFLPATHAPGFLHMDIYIYIYISHNSKTSSNSLVTLCTPWPVWN